MKYTTIDRRTRERDTPDRRSRADTDAAIQVEVSMPDGQTATLLYGGKTTTVGILSAAGYQIVEYDRLPNYMKDALEKAKGNAAA